MDETFEKIYNENNTGLNEDTALFEKVYAEAEMLNEMNPKLRALLAAGLIGTAGLGAASCMALMMSLRLNSQLKQRMQKKLL